MSELEKMKEERENDRRGLYRRIGGSGLDYLENFTSSKKGLEKERNNLKGFFLEEKEDSYFSKTAIKKRIIKIENEIKLLKIAINVAGKMVEVGKEGIKIHKRKCYE